MEQNKDKIATALSKTDPNSWSNFDEVAVKHIHLKIKVDFSKNILYCKEQIECVRKISSASILILDIKDLNIESVWDECNGEELKYTVGEPYNDLGSSLTIPLKNWEDKKAVINITYSTSPESSALQWLTPEQTAGKEHPFLFSQCQAIHARSLLPCQDTPSCKFTYTAEVTVSNNLVALMSALRDGKKLAKKGDTVCYKFKQPIVIPSYLIALAVGKLESRKIGPRSHVWSEKELVDKAAYEFSQTEDFLQAAEKICGPYVWGIYDLLVLPPSFPYGGMENPCLTFLTPTLLAGDKSLADVVAHEISHSWTGNLVTNCSFEHFWLNEGFTVFIERKILGNLTGEPNRHFHGINGLKELKFTIERLGHENPHTKLVVDLKGINPDETFSACPYEKGHTLLFHLENLIGGASLFDPFLRSYIEKYKFQSISTKDFIDYFMDYFSSTEEVKNINWDLWLYTPGMPPVLPKYDDSLQKIAHELADKWIKWDLDRDTVPPFDTSEFKQFSPKQMEAFLNVLLDEPSFPLTKVKTLQNHYDLNEYDNCEIKYRWLSLCAKCHWIEQVPKTLMFVNQQGRMKFVRPLYRDLYEWKDARERAITNFLKHKDKMMFVTAHNVSKDLHITL